MVYGNRQERLPRRGRGDMAEASFALLKAEACSVLFRPQQSPQQIAPGVILMRCGDGKKLLQGITLGIRTQDLLESVSILLSTEHSCLPHRIDVIRATCMKPVTADWYTPAASLLWRTQA